MPNKHSFHIPVMGIGYTIDTPFKVAQFGIDSVVFISDDVLIEKMRKSYCRKFDIPFTPITEKTEDCRARRITSYLNLINKVVSQKIEAMKSVTDLKCQELKDYFSMLPDSSSIKKEFLRLTDKYINIQEIRNWLKSNLSAGSIDVNIMTKLDRETYKKNVQLPVEFNNAHAALRGYAKSDLASSIVFSAGLNPRLFSYLENFDDFYPNQHGEIKKKIVLKVSDYRSALVQGKFLAKKGLWVTEYRIESGLNCGGHAFATDGFLMGPILSEFKNKRKELISTVNEVLLKALADKNRAAPSELLPLKITAQGGVGTKAEHQFLLDEYEIDSVGWGTPFLLVPEATSVDNGTIDKLIKAKEKDLYLSNISPLGVPFNNLRGNTKDKEKLALAANGKPGSSCPRKYLAINKEFTDQTICTASRKYQKLKIREINKIDSSTANLAKIDKVIESACLCVGLGTSALIANEIDHNAEGEGVLVCPGPNMAYFSKKMTLKEMVDHIYGRANVITRSDRPHMFIKELNIYIDFLKKKIDESQTMMTVKQEKYLLNFAENLKSGIDYYQSLFSEFKDKIETAVSDILFELDSSRKILNGLQFEIKKPAMSFPEDGRICKKSMPGIKV